MRKQIGMAAVIGMSFLFAHTVTAGEMVRYERTIFMADSGGQDKKAVNHKKETDKKAQTNNQSHKKAKHRAKRHQHHPHHHRHHHHHQMHDEGIRLQSERQPDEIYGEPRKSRATTLRQYKMQDYIQNTAPNHR